MEILAPRKHNIILDATALTRFMSCNLLYDYTQNHCFEKMGGKSNSLEIGSIIHKVLEIYYGERIKGFNHSNAVGSGLIAGQMYITGCRDCRDFVPYTCPICHGDIGNCEFCQHGTIMSPSCGHLVNEYPGVENTPAESNREKGRSKVGWKWALETCEQYFDYYQNDHWVPLEVEVVKKKILYEDDEIRIMWKAKLDLTADTNQGIYPIDHKTMQQLRPSFSLNNQFIGQCHVMGTRSTIINRIGLQTSLKPKEKFTREFVSYSASRLLEWQSEILPYRAKELRNCQKSGYYPPSGWGINCINKFGICMMMKICETDPEGREGELRQSFRIGEKWDPK